MADEDKQDEPQKGSSKKIIIMVIMALVILGIGAGGGMMFMGSTDDNDQETTDIAEEEIKQEKKAIYHDLHPAFVANFSGQSNKNYMQVYVVAMSYENDVIEDLKLHMPAVRNAVLMSLSTAESKKVQTVEGKEELRRKVLDTINETMEEKTGNAGIEDIYFTKFVSQ